MAIMRDWRCNKEMWIRVLERQTGAGVEVWNDRIRRRSFADPPTLRAWLSRQHVTGYAQSLLVMERFGYPDFVTATVDQLIDAQYADRAHLRPVYDAVVQAAARCGELVIQARKTYVSLVTLRRTFARVQPSAKTYVILGLRPHGRRPGGRLQRSTMHETIRLQIRLSAPDEVAAEVRRCLRQAYLENS